MTDSLVLVNHEGIGTTTYLKKKTHQFTMTYTNKNHHFFSLTLIQPIYHPAR